MHWGVFTEEKDQTCAKVMDVVNFGDEYGSAMVGKLWGDTWCIPQPGTAHCSHLPGKIMENNQV